MNNIEKKSKLSFSVFGELIRNSFRVSKLIWSENKGMSIFLVFAFLTVSVAPFIQSGSIALLINNLVDIKNITESKIFLIIGMMILASLLPSIFFITRGST